MRVSVTNQGVVIPPKFFKGIKEVDISLKENRIMIIPIKKSTFIRKNKKNPIMKLAGIIENGHLTENIDEELYGRDK